MTLMHPVPKGYLFSNTALVKLLIPIAIEQILLHAVGTCDQMMVASLGAVSVSAVSISGQVNAFMHVLYNAMGVGGAIAVAHALGAGNRKGAIMATRQLLQSVFVLASIMGILVILFRWPLLLLLFGDMPDELLKQAVSYMSIIAVTYPLSAVRWSAAGVFRTMNKAKYSMYCGVIANLVNLGLNYLFIFVFKWGVNGAALATAGSLSTSFTIMLWLLGDRKMPVWFQAFGKWRFNGETIRKILYFSIPAGLSSVVFQFGRILTIGVIVKYGGTTQMAAFSVILTLASIGTMPGQTCNLAVNAVVGQATGTGDEVQTKYYVRKLLTWIYVIATLTLLLLLLFLPLLLRIYSKLPPETIQMVKDTFMVYIPFLIVFWPVSFMLMTALQAMNDVKFAMWISIASMVFFRVGSSYLLAPIIKHGLYAVCAGMYLDWVARSICTVWRYKSGAWRKYFHSKKLKG